MKNKKKTNTKTIFQRILIVLVAGTMLVGTSGFFLLSHIVAKVLKDDATQSIMNQEPSSVYAADGNKVYEFGGISRENVSYDQIPQSLIDAFLAIEDSRYYEHNGFDLPRFISSALTNIRSGAFAQGGSTLTMQLVDNTMMKPVEEAMKAQGVEFSSFDKIERKVQEIYLSMKLENDWTKEEIITRYLNEINFGGGALGIQKGAKYYFKKDVSELNLSESAFLAGVINAPYNYNPFLGYSLYLNDEANGYFNFYQAATQRRNQTLALMLHHGFITKNEHDLAKSCKLAFQLDKGQISSEDEDYKLYMTQVQQEVINLIGKDPATTPMSIYTAMDPIAQKTASALARGEGIELPKNQYYQLGSAVINNQNGEITAIIGGRTDIGTGFDTGNFRDRSKEQKQPGSTAKPILDYVMAFEHLGWCTSRVMEDTKPYQLDANHQIGNADGNFHGNVSLEQALAQSLNTTALLTMEEYLNRIGSTSMIDYMKNIGVSEESADAFNIQYAIGGSSLQMSPIQLASAYSVLANGGHYNKPHMVRKIVLEDGTSYEFAPESQQVLSEQACFMISDLLYKVVNGKYRTYNLLGLEDFSAYPVYGKTGTTNWSAEEAKLYGGAMKDEWTCTYTSEYSIATWTGFDMGIPGENTSINDYLFMNINTKINKAILDKITTANVSKISRPADISEYGGGYIKTQFLKNAAKNNPKTVTSTPNETDKLAKLIAELENINPNEYSEESYNILANALEKAKFTLNSDEASIEDVKNAIDELQKARKQLKEKEVAADFTALNQIIETAKTNYLDISKYRKEDVDALQRAISSGISVTLKSDSSQKQIDKAYRQIQSCINQCIANQKETQNQSNNSNNDNNQPQVDNNSNENEDD